MIYEEKENGDCCLVLLLFNSFSFYKCFTQRWERGHTICGIRLSLRHRWRTGQNIHSIICSPLGLVPFFFTSCQRSKTIWIKVASKTAVNDMIKNWAIDARIWIPFIFTLLFFQLQQASNSVKKKIFLNINAKKFVYPTGWQSHLSAWNTKKRFSFFILDSGQKKVGEKIIKFVFQVSC